MSIIRPDTLRGQTILAVGLCLLFFHIVSLMLYGISSASTVTLEREEQIADRIVTITRLIEHALAEDRPYLAEELSGSRFQISVDQTPLTDATDDSAAMITTLITHTLGPLDHAVSADYGTFTGQFSDIPRRNVSIEHMSGMLRIHETLLVSIDLPDGTWLNFVVSGSAWDHILPLNAIPSLTLMTLAAVLITAWAVNKPLRSLSRFASASDRMGMNVHAALPVGEEGPKEIRDAAHAFNQMQSRVQRLLEERNQMLGAISHDFRTLITRLRLRAESIVDEEQRGKAIRDLDEMETMISVTLAFARDEANTEPRELRDVLEVIQEVVHDLEIPNERVSIHAPQGVQIECQPVGIKRVLSNVIRNGIFYGDSIRVELMRANDHAIIHVDDSGPGIDPGQRDRVFTPFCRLESSRSRETGGVGLGLSIAQTIVHAHGGTINLQDAPLGGLRVHISLPLSSESA